MTQKHTQGPWTFRPLTGEDNRGMGYIEDANGHDIIHAGVMDLPSHENQANAALIAAAPAMKLELEQQKTRWESAINAPDEQLMIKVAEAAIAQIELTIAKAEGK